eukprot:199280_1
MKTTKVVCRHFSQDLTVRIVWHVHWLVLKSKPDVDHWVRLYVRRLCVETDTVHLRLLVDMLWVRSENIKDAPSEGKNFDDSEVETIPCWWLSSAASTLELDCKQVV